MGDARTDRPRRPGNMPLLTELDGFAAILDLPTTNRAFFGFHALSLSLVICFPRRLQRAWSRMKLEQTVLGGFQILAHFAKAPRASFSPALGRRNAESAMKQVSEVTVTGETEVQSQRAEIRFACADPFESSPQAKPVTVLVKRQAGFPAEKAREMEGGGIHGAGNFPQGQVFGKARSQQQAGPFCLLAMSPGGGGTAWLGPEAAWVINAPNDRRQEVHSQLVEGQSVVALGQWTLVSSKKRKENSLITQRMSELKRLLRPILNVRLVAGYRFAQQVRGEGEHRAIIAVAHRVGHAVRL